MSPAGEEGGEQAHVTEPLHVRHVCMHPVRTTHACMHARECDACMSMGMHACISMSMH